MTDREFFNSIGSDYDDVVRRLGTEAAVRRFILMFKDDPSYEELKRALSDGDVNTAFRSAHTMKGVAINLGFTRLYEASSELTEILRAGNLDGADGSFEGVEREYGIIMNYLKTLG